MVWLPLFDYNGNFDRAFSRIKSDTACMKIYPANFVTDFILNSVRFDVNKQNTFAKYT